MTTTLRTATGDLAVPRVIVRDPAAVAIQTIQDGLKIWAGEWFEDTDYGMPWLSILGQKIINSNQIQALLQAFLYSVPGIVAVTASATFNSAQRSFTYTYQATLNTGQIIQGGSAAPPQLMGSN